MLTNVSFFKKTGIIDHYFLMPNEIFVLIFVCYYEKLTKYDFRTGRMKTLVGTKTEISIK